MKKENENVEIMEDDEIVTLYDDDDQPVDFYEVACVEYEDEYYVLLEPVEEMEGIEEGEVLIFKLEEQEDGTDMFMPVDDEQLLNAVFDEYIKAAADHDCDCGDCEGHCDCTDEHCSCGEDHCGCGHEEK
ncbi:MAG: DUF1292 domain-containing protein [Christensenellales bacterium]